VRSAEETPDFSPTLFGYSQGAVLKLERFDTYRERPAESRPAGMIACHTKSRSREDGWKAGLQARLPIAAEIYLDARSAEIVGQTILAAAGFQPAVRGLRQARSRLKGGCGQDCPPHY
jgi:hypothetical protein